MLTTDNRRATLKPDRPTPTSYQCQVLGLRDGSGAPARLSASVNAVQMSGGSSWTSFAPRGYPRALPSRAPSYGPGRGRTPQRHGEPAAGTLADAS